MEKDALALPSRGCWQRSTTPPTTGGHPSFTVSTERPARPKKSPAPRVHAASRATRREYYEAYGLFVAAFREAAERLRAGNLGARFHLEAFRPRCPSCPGSAEREAANEITAGRHLNNWERCTRRLPTGCWERSFLSGTEGLCPLRRTRKVLFFQARALPAAESGEFSPLTSALALRIGRHLFLSACVQKRGYLWIS